MKCKLIAYTPNPERVVATAARICYSDSSVDDIMARFSDKKLTEDFIDKLNEMGHASPFEHVSFTFAIEGVSRALLAQITRHRLASFSVRSQRYCAYDNPEDLEEMVRNVSSYAKSKQAREEYITSYLVSCDKYNELIDLEEDKENARMVLPNAALTTIMFTANARELMHFFNLRCCIRAQKEIRTLANTMLKQVKEVAPLIFKYAGASCVKGYCTEGSKSCHKAPTIQELINNYNATNSDKTKK